MMKKSMAKCLIVLLMVSLLTGCGMFETKDKLDNPEYNAEESIKPEKLQPLDAPETDQDVSDDVNTDSVVDQLEGSEAGIAVDTKAELETPTAEGTETNEGVEEIQENDDSLQIVYLGDSIFDNARDGSGIPALTSAMLDAKVYNLAIAGTTAALKRDESNTYEDWSSCGLLGVTYVLGGHVTPNIFSGYHMRDVLNTFDPKQTDVFVIEYGINDFLAGYPCSKSDPDVANDPYCYYGAIQMACNSLLQDFPSAIVVYCAPHYVQFWNNGVFIGDCNTVNGGLGTLNDYAQAGRNAATQSGAHCFFPYDDVEIDAYNADKCLEDGIHLTDEGRAKYAEALSSFIRQVLMESSN